MVTYEQTYQSFLKYREMIGLPPIEFEDWMHKREDAGTPKTQTKQFLEQVHA